MGPTGLIGRLFDLRGRAALITGGAGNVGRATARLLAEAGAAVSIVDNDGRGVDDTVEALLVSGYKAVGFHADVRDRSTAERAVAAAVESIGVPTILVNNVGIFRAFTADFVATPDAYWDEILAVNLTSAFVFSRAAVRAMTEVDAGGAIVNVASIGGLIAEPRHSSYAASKGGLLSLTRAMARDLAQYDIRVNAVAPGLIERESLAWEAPGRREAFVDRAPLRRLVPAEDVAAAIMFLVSAGSGSITGQSIVVDAGMTISGYVPDAGEPE
jgi:NAD(P)-dependent dehydrogenase (short-subunit alcohol dehydrogenase family)